MQVLIVWLLGLFLPFFPAPHRVGDSIFIALMAKMGLTLLCCKLTHD
jgi:hypothetical protein